MEILFNIKTTAQLQALEKAQAAYRKSIDQTKALGQSTAHLESELRKVDVALASNAASAVRTAEALRQNIKAVKSAGGNTTPLRQELSAVTGLYGLQGPGVIGALRNLPGAGALTRLAGPAGAAAAILGGGAKSLREFSGNQDSAAGLDQALAQQGNLTEQNRAQYQELAGELQQATAIAGGEWLGVLKRLTQFGSRPESVGMDVAAVKNLAGVLRGDLNRAAELYSRALQGQFTGFRELGFAIKDTGSQMEKLKDLQLQLAQRGGGQLEARAQSLSGQFKKIKNSLNDLFSGIGQKLATSDTFQRMISLAALSLEFWAAKISATIPKLEGLRNATAAVAQGNQAAAASLADFGSKLESSITDKAKAAASALDQVTGAIDRQQAAQDRVTDAKLALNLERLRQRRDLSPEQKLAAEQQLRESARGEKFQRSQLAGQAKIAAQERFATGEEGKARQGAALVQRLQQAAGVVGAREKARAEFGSIAGQLEEARAEEERLAGIVSKFQESGEWNPLNYPQIAAAEENLPGARQRVQLLQRLLLGRNQDLATANQRADSFGITGGLPAEFMGLTAAQLQEKAREAQAGLETLQRNAGTARQGANTAREQITQQQQVDRRVFGLESAANTLANQAGLNQAGLGNRQQQRATRRQELERQPESPGRSRELQRLRNEDLADQLALETDPERRRQLAGQMSGTAPAAAAPDLGNAARAGQAVADATTRGTNELSRALESAAGGMRELQAVADRQGREFTAIWREIKNINDRYKSGGTR